MNLEPDVDQIGREVFGNFFSEGCNKCPFIPFGSLANFFYQIVDLVFQRTNFYGWINDARGANDLLDGFATLFEFVGARGGGEKDDLIGDIDEFIEIHGAVIECGGESEAMVNEGKFSGAVAVVHTANLGKGYMGFIDDGDEVGRKVVDETFGSIAGISSRELASNFRFLRKANFTEHFEVIFSSHFNALGFDQAVLFFEVGDLLDFFLVDGFKCCINFVLGHNKVSSRRDHDVR